MIYQPRNVTPTDTYVDVTYVNYNHFSMEIATNKSVVAYKLVILDWNNNVVYTGALTNLSTPLYNGDTLFIPVPSVSNGLANGNDYKWHVYLYESTNGVNQYSMQIAKGIIQSVTSNTDFTIQSNISIVAGMYINYGNEFIEISSYNAETGAITIGTSFSETLVAGAEYQIYSNFIKTSPDYVMYAREKAECNISTIPATVTTRNYTFTGTYTQTDGEPIISHTWTIGRNPVITHHEGYITCESYTLEYTTGKVYSANLTFSYDRFKSGETYVVFLDVESTHNNVATQKVKAFDVEYPLVTYDEQPEAFVDCSKNAIQISWVTPVETQPSLIDNNVYTGNIQPGTISTNSFYIEKNLNSINPGYQIIINNVSFTIVNYDKNTGLLTIEEPVSNIITVGETYTISGVTDIPVDTAVDLYRNNPYNGVNSIDTKQYSVVYEGEPIIGEYPTSYEITMQFKPDSNFFYGTTGLFNDINPLAIIESDALDEVTGMMMIFIHKNYVCASTPELDDGNAKIQQLGNNNTTTAVHLASNIDLTATPYIYFIDYGYIEKVNAYNSSTQMATLNKNLPFAPEQGTRYVMMNTLSTPFYNNIQDEWVLQSSLAVQGDKDYRWIDNSNSWDDTKFWTEGGTGIERVANQWWKLRITNDSITLTRGGV